MTLSSSIVDPSLRRIFEAAERHFDEGNTVESVRTLKKAFDSARGQWDSDQQRASRFRYNARWRDSLGIADTIETATSRFQDLFSVAPFALDLGEYIWWESLVEPVGVEPPVPISAEEARRAMAFVFSWIIRWEAFSATYVRDRLALRPSPPRVTSTRLGGAPELLPGAKVEILTQHPPTDQRTRHVLLSYGAGTDEESAKLWDSYLQRSAVELQQEGKVPWSSSGIWGGTFKLTVSDATDVDEVVACVDRTIERACSIRQTVETTATREQQHREERLPRLRAALEQLKLSDGGAPFSSIQLMIEYRRDGTPAEKVWAYFVSGLADVGREVHARQQWYDFQRSSYTRVHPVGIETDLTAPPDNVRSEAEQALALLETWRAQIESERNDLVAEEEELRRMFELAIERDRDREG